MTAGDAADPRARAAELRRRLSEVRGVAAPEAAQTGTPRLTPIQRQIWASEALGQAGSGYTSFRAWRLRGPLDAGALARAVEDVVARHDAFAMRVIAQGGIPVPVFDAAAAWPGLATEQAAGPDPEAWLQGRLGQLARHRFDLAAGPLLAVTLIRMGPADHVLAWALHHLISDDWSLSVIARDLGACYAAALRGGVPDLPGIGAGYRGFLSAEAGERAAGDGSDGGCDDAPWPRSGQEAEDPGDPGRARCVFATLDAALMARLQQAARGLGVSVFVLMSALYQGLLSRLCDAPGVAIGVSRSLRLTGAAEAAVGMYLDHVNIAGEVAAGTRLADLTARIAQALRDQPRDAFAPVRGPAARATLVTYPPIDPAPSLPDVAATVIRPAERGYPVDLHLAVHPVADGADLVLSGRVSAFAPALLDRLLTLFRSHLEVVAMAAAPGDLRLGELPLFPDAAARAALLALAERPVAAPDGQDIAARFHAVAAADPDAPAFRSPARRWSYAELTVEAAAVADWLAGQGLGPGDVVGLALPRGADLVRATLGALRAGLVLAPIDPGYPEARRAAMAEIAGCALILAPAADPHDPRLRALPPPRGSTGAPMPPPPAPRDPDGLAYVVFTSGSTGRPKGVETTHRAILRLAAGLQPRPPGPGDRMAQIASPSFDGAFIEVFGALLNGAELVSPEGDPGDHRDVADLFRAGGVTHAFVTTGLFNLILDSVPGAFDGVRWMAVGGEAMSADHAMRFLAAHPQATLMNVYGPTENGALTTAHAVRPTDRRLVPIGQPLPGNIALVLGRGGRPVPPGFAGELWIGGPGLARGYVGLPEQTSAAFQDIPRDRLGLPGAGTLRLYATGDRVVQREDGAFCYAGRRDAQVKFSGYRVELAEIEAALRRIDGVRDAMVLARHGADGRVEALEAGVVGAPWLFDGQGAPLRRALRQDLPAIMVPSVLLPLGALPLTPNGKRDATALAARIAAARRDAAADAQPVGIDPVLVDIWTEFAGPPVDGADSAFFLSGGQSLAAMQMLAEVETRLHRRIPIADFFDAPTLGGLAALVAGTGHCARARHLVLMRDGPRDRPPLVMVTGLHGACLWAREMLDALPHATGAVYGLNLDPADPAAAGVDSLGALAGPMVDEILAEVPDGRVILVGYSFAGFLGFVLTAEMEGRGRPPAGLIQIDPNTNFLQPGEPAARQTVTAAARLATLRAEWRLAPIDTPIDYVFCATAFPLPRRRDADEWAVLTRGGVRVRTLQTSHLAVIYGAWARVLAKTVAGILSGDAPPEVTLRQPFSAPDIARLYAARDALAAGDGATAAEIAAALLAGPARGLAFVGVLHLHALAAMGATRALLRVARTEAARPAPDPALLAELGRILRRSGQRWRARRMFRRLFDNSGAEVQGAFDLVAMFIAAGMGWRARRIAALAARRGRSPITGLLCRAAIARAAGARGEAFDLILAALGRSDAGVPHVAAVCDRILKPQDHAFALSLVAAAETQFRGAEILARIRGDWEARAAAAADGSGA